MRYFLMILLLMPALAFAEEPTAEVAALADMSTRYTLGPWEGEGKAPNCTLSNSEPLSFGLLELNLVHDQIMATVTPVWPDQKPVVEVFPLDPASTPFIKVDRYTYDTRGLSQAYRIFMQCIEGKLPAVLPSEPLEESDPVTVARASEWKIIRLMQGNYKYAGYALQDGSPLGLWVHAVDKFVLSVTTEPGFKAGAPYRADVNGISLEYAPQEGSILIPLPDELLRQLEESESLSLKVAGYNKTFALKGFREVVVALQPYE